ncbi:MAG: hypothetical protein GKR88_01910 [Flavobacteriaceae bacterium]|nr:MAG: hypothetical protein GKR88_01910 [Flavobacteriaceae bacterium]
MISYKLVLKKQDYLLLKYLNINIEKFFKKSYVDSYTFYYNLKEASSYQTIKNIDSDILFYMSPYSGIQYGCRGGFGNLILGNRCHYKKIASKINKENLFVLFTSINPASQLTAIEHYYKNKKI